MGVYFLAGCAGASALLAWFARSATGGGALHATTTAAQSDFIPHADAQVRAPGS
jgi:hypothetical protein